MKSRSITRPEHAVVTQRQVNGLVDHISALIAGLDQRLTEVHTEVLNEVDGRAIGILRAAEQDARTQDAIVRVKLESVERWAVAGCGIAAVALLVAVWAVFR
jgi:hypothetical protein